MPDAPKLPPHAPTLDPALAETLQDPTAQPLPATTPAVAAGQRVGGRYQVRALVGKGGMGAVYRAYDEVLEKDVALKFVREELAGTDGIARLRDEVRLAQQVTHPNVCRTYDLEKVDASHVVKMEFVDGEVLSERIARDGRLPLAEVLHVARAVADGLAAAHAQGVIHRDLKPHNILVEHGTRRVVLMDFGVARVVRARGGRTDGPMAGTPAYMAPEQARGDDVDGRADLYSLGCVLFEMLAGEVPFVADTPIAAIAKHAVAPIPDVRTRRPDAPPALARLVTRLLAKRPDERPADARAVAAALAPPPRWRRAALASTAALLVVAAIVGFTLGARRRDWQPRIVERTPSYEENADALTVSPDGKWLAYVSDRDGDYRVYVEPVATALPSLAVTPPSLVPQTLRWAHDGRSLLVVDNAETAWRVAVENGVGVAVTELAKRVEIVDDCAGTLVGIVTDDNVQRIVARPRQPGERALAPPATSKIVGELRCSPDGKLVAWSETLDDAPESEAPSALWVAPLDGGAPREVLDDGRRNVGPVFASDGKSLIYVVATGADRTLAEVAVDGGAPVALTRGPGKHDAPAPAPDGRTLFYDDDASWWPLFAVPLDGTGPARRVTQTHDSFVDAKPMPDGKSLVVVSKRDGARHVSLLAVDGTGERDVGPGVIATVTRRGDLVYATAVEHGSSRLMVVPVDGPPRLLAELRGELRFLTVDAANALHGMLVDDQNGAYPVVLRTDATHAREEPAPALLVDPAPAGGWRLVGTADASGVRYRLALVPPGVASSSPRRTVVAESWAWAPDGAHLYYVDGRALHRLAVETGDDATLRTLTLTQRLCSISPDGRTAWVVGNQGHVRRRAIVDFDARPRPSTP